MEHAARRRHDRFDRAVAVEDERVALSIVELDGGGRGVAVELRELGGRDVVRRRGAGGQQREGEEGGEGAGSAEDRGMRAATSRDVPDSPP
ncbi:MAG TPA: hypothetical protein VHB21_25775, partial [Minicystis sp.]|nr:hypothetical protein [Minicystis sp.]